MNSYVSFLIRLASKAAGGELIGNYIFNRNRILPMHKICRKLEFGFYFFILNSGGYNSVWSDEWIAVKILEESVNFIDKTVTKVVDRFKRASFISRIQRLTNALTQTGKAMPFFAFARASFNVFLA